MKGITPVLLAVLCLGVSNCSDLTDTELQVREQYRVESAVGSVPAGLILVSDALQGSIWSYDTKTQEVALFHHFAENGNYDIKYSGPNTLVIANCNGRIDQLDLRSGEVTTLSDDPELGFTIEVAVSHRGVYYITDHGGDEWAGIMSFDVRTGQVDMIAQWNPDDPTGPLSGNPDGIIEDTRGKVLVVSGTRVYRLSPKSKSIEILADIPDHRLTGIVFTRDGALIVASGDPAAVFQVDPNTGAYSTLFEGEPLQFPADVAVDVHGNVYVIDPEATGLYVIEGKTGTIRELYTGTPFQDVVDILLTPFTGRQ